MTNATQVQIKDANNQIQTVSTLDNAMANGIPGIGFTVISSNTVTRPADTSAYSVGDIVAQSTTNSLCYAIPFTAARYAGGTGMLRRCRVKVNDIAWANAEIYVHVFKNTPTFTNGDNGAFSAGVSESEYLGAFDVTFDRTFSDYVKGIGVPRTGSEINFDANTSSQSLYYTIETRTALTPAASETFTTTFEILQN